MPDLEQGLATRCPLAHPDKNRPFVSRPPSFPDRLLSQVKSATRP